MLQLFWRVVAADKTVAHIADVDALVVLDQRELAHNLAVLILLLLLRVACLGVVIVFWRDP